MEQVRTVVLPVAGRGKRLDPLTRRTPKALVTLCGRPLLDYVIEESATSGLRRAILVVSPAHRPAYERFIRAARKKFRALDFQIRMQAQAFGNGDAILAAEDAVRREPFAVRFADDLMFGAEHGLALLLAHFNGLRAPLCALERVPRRLLSQYGVAIVKPPVRPPLHRIVGVVEKPRTKDFPDRARLSNLAIVGAYVLTPAIISHLRFLKRIAPPLRDGLPLTAAFHRELDRGGEMYGVEYPGTRLDCGTLAGLSDAAEFVAGGAHGTI